jgi:hypothetical protein
MRWIRADGRLMTLAGHTPAAWADVMYERFIALGCTPLGARRLVAPIRAAEEWAS